MKVMHWDTFVFLPGECYMILFISRYKYIYLWHDTCFFLHTFWQLRHVLCVSEGKSRFSMQVQ